MTSRLTGYLLPMEAARSALPKKMHRSSHAWSEQGEGLLWGGSICINALALGGVQHFWRGTLGARWYFPSKRLLYHNLRPKRRAEAR